MSKRRIIDFTERRWAYSKLLQRFTGTYVLDEESDLYFAIECNPELVKRVSLTLRQLPKQLHRVCLRHDVTFSFCQGLTATESLSTFYADRSEGSPVSPHIEMSATSLQPSLVLPHLAHETAHVFWSTLAEETRAAYANFLVRATTASTMEVTGYAQAYLERWRTKAGQSEAQSAANKLLQLKSWVEESFCETVAVLSASAAKHPHYDKDSNVNLIQRWEAIRDLTGLLLAAPLPEARH